MNRIRENIVFDVMLSLVLVGYASTPPARAQAPASATAIPKSPSPELVGSLTKKLSVTPEQATGGAGALFALAKSKLSVEDFSKVS